jgi:hypothetical protein
MANNLRNDVRIALESATDVLERFDSPTLKSLPVSDQLTYALAQATVGIGYSLLQIVQLKDEELDARQD